MAARSSRVERCGLGGIGVRIHERNDDGRRPERENADPSGERRAGARRRRDLAGARGHGIPALTFEIDGDVFKVSRITRHDNGRCADLEVGARIAWAGAKRAPETAVVVQRVKFAPLSR